MNTKKWLTLGLTVALAGCLGWAVAACAPTEPNNPNDPDTPAHTHNYDAWDHDATQHWKYCDEHGTDKSNIDETTRANHTFKNGSCECGATESTTPPDTPTVDLDTREFYVVGGGAGDLKTGTWTGPNAAFKFIKADKADAEGYTVYTFQMKLYSADEFKFIEKNTISTTEKDDDGNFLWDETTTFKLVDFDVTGVPDAFSGGDNIVVNTGADGVYKFTIRTKKGGEAKENKVKVELVEKVKPMGVEDQYEMYLVGSIASKPTTKWPSSFSPLSNVTTSCYKLELQEDGETFSVEVELNKGDSFKVWNYKLGNTSAGYYPTGTNNNLTVSSKGMYVVSWKIGDADVKIEEHAHNYTKWNYDSSEHWKECPVDSAIDETTRAEHSFDPETKQCECGLEQTADPDWRISADGKFEAYVGDYENMVIPAKLKEFPGLGAIFGGKDSVEPLDENWQKVKSVTVEDGSTTFKMEKGALLSYDGTTLYAYFLPYNTVASVTFDTVKTVAPAAFYRCLAPLTSVTLPNAVTLEQWAFRKANALETISAPKVETIGEHCFDTCGALQSAEFPSIKKLEQGAFNSAKNLQTLIFGKDLAEMAVFTFQACPKLESVTIGATTPPTLASNLLYYQCNNIKFYVPAESVEAYKAAENWSTFADKIFAPSEAVSLAVPAEVALIPERKD